MRRLPDNPFGTAVQMMTSAIYGHSLTPAALADEKGNVVMVQHCASPHWLERLLRPVSHLARSPRPRRLAGS